MDTSLLLFLAAVALGAYVQSITGFALGIFVLAAVALLHFSSIPVAAMAMNIMTLANSTVMVLPRLKKVHWPTLRLTLIGTMPAMVVGVLLLNGLSNHAQNILRILLGLMIIGGGLVLVWRPHPRATLSSKGGFIGMGLISGLLGGLFSVSGPPLVYQFYRQPLPLLRIRITLVTLFSIMSVGRLTVVGVQGQITEEVLRMGGLSIPVVLAAAWLGTRYPPRISDKALRRGVFVLLVITGSGIVFTAL
ncbi:sulfite exporter TauE/SafE family protein [Alloalcanivorax mobilis]|uniref:sulfite exporter TauE/SafE family protein n=1 Tax=Alloalcanivorax mobilis TaxID=2019569 RepID=UPI000C763BAC|nr:sulfite exporter TauE/SafE family protein [Alloalcanivorax mobilis]